LLGALDMLGVCVASGGSLQVIDLMSLWKIDP